MRSSSQGNDRDDHGRKLAVEKQEPSSSLGWTMGGARTRSPFMSAGTRTEPEERERVVERVEGEARQWRRKGDGAACDVICLSGLPGNTTASPRMDGGYVPC